MTDAEYERICGRLRFYTERWAHTIGLGWWNINREFVRSVGDLAHPEDAEASAVCRADWRYLHATIGFNIWTMTGLDDKQIERIVIHELMHVFLDEAARGKGSHDHIERVAETLALGFRWLREDLTRPIEGEY